MIWIVSLYIVIAIVWIIAMTVTAYESFCDDDEDACRQAVKLGLIAPVWPIGLVYGIYRATLFAYKIDTDWYKSRKDENV